MERAEQIAVAKRLLGFIRDAQTALAPTPYLQPVAEYVDPEVDARERETFFRSGVMCVGLGADLAGPGSYRTHDLSGTPLLLVRDQAGAFRAYLNVCRHRGARVAEGCGEARGFTCPYHAWSYGLDGTLQVRPDEAAFAELARTTLGLRPLPAEERHGLLWVCPTPSGSLDLTGTLGGLDQELSHYRLDRFHYYRSQDLTRRMNWKLVVDTFLESYHFCVLHRESICSIFYHNLGTFDAFGPCLRLVSPRKSILTLSEQPEGDWDVLPHTVVIYVLFPNSVLVWQGEQVELWQVYPGASPDESRLRLTLYSPEPALTDKARRHWDRNIELVLNVVENEDFPVGEGTQAGFRSGAQDHIVFGRNEPALAHYHRALSAATRR